MLKILLPQNSKPKEGNRWNRIKNIARSNTRIIKVYRYEPTAKSPQIDSYEVENVPEKTILQVLDDLKADIDPSISYRKSCREGACGSCGMNVNKKNILACTTKMKDIKGDIEIYPLPHMKVVKDLVCDMSLFFKQYKSIKPWVVTGNNSNINALKDKSCCKKNNSSCSKKESCNLENEQEKKVVNGIQSKEDRGKLDGLYECIMCGCCSTQCPSYWWNNNEFLGPAVSLQALRFIEDSRDSITEERKEFIKNNGGLDHCHSIFSCTTFCPKGLNPADAIVKLKSTVFK